MPSLNEVIVRATQIAVGRGTDPHNSPVIDAGLTIEALYPHALRYCIGRDLRNGGNPQNYIRTHSLEVLSGESTLPNTVLREFLASSFLPEEAYSAYVPYPDYIGSRFNNLVCYYSLNGTTFYYSCAVPEVALSTGSFECTAGSQTITCPTVNLVTSAHVGKRLYLSIGSGLAVDAIINQILTTTTFNVRAKALLSTALGVAEGGTIYDTDRYITSRSLTAVNATNGVATVTCAGGAFTSADVGRRLKVYDGATLIIDAIINSINSASSVEMRGQAVATTAIGTADVMYVETLLSTPSLPDVPASASVDLGLTPKLAADVIVTMAAAVTGELNLNKLMEAV